MARVRGKTLANFVLSIIMAVLGIAVLVTGLILWLGFPHGGPHAGLHGVKFWGYEKEFWKSIHLYLALTLFAVCCIHFALNIDFLVAVWKALSRRE